jgi:diacylglycerol kinase (ATP)
MRSCVILNPNAGSVDDLARIEETLGKRESVVVRRTAAAGDAERLAAEAVGEGFELVVAAGGDGTLNEVVNGLVAGFGRTRLGILPLGTGNDFARTIGVPADLDAALEVLAAGRLRRIDVGRVELRHAETSAAVRRYFVNVSAGGFAGVMSERMDDEVKSRWGPLAYLRTALETFAEREGYSTVLTLDGGEVLSLPVYNVVVSNARFVAAGIPVAPQAELDDGLLDVMIVPESSIPQLAALVPQVLLGRHTESGLVELRRARRIEVRSEPPMPFNVDGELVGESPAIFEALPRVLDVVVGEPPA